jgi:hypothetical protein
MNTRIQLRNFAKAEAYAISLYENRLKYSSSEEILKLVKRKFRSNKFTLEATEAAAECWNYHSETGPWYRDLTDKIGYFRFEDLRWARNYVKTRTKTVTAES